MNVSVAICIQVTEIKLNSLSNHTFCRTFNEFTFNYLSWWLFLMNLHVVHSVVLTISYCIMVWMINILVLKWKWLIWFTFFFSPQALGSLRGHSARYVRRLSKVLKTVVRALKYDSHLTGCISLIVSIGSSTISCICWSFPDLFALP